MISQFEVPRIIQSAFRKELDTKNSLMHSLNLNISLDLYESVHSLASITKKATQKRNFTLLKKCFLIAEHLYSEGDRQVKNVLENIYIYSLSGCVADDKHCSAIYKSLLPARFYSLYVHQMLDSKN